MGGEIDMAEFPNYWGVVKVLVLPPKRLYIPVLPLKVDGKLLFPLCRSCAFKKSVQLCGCPDKDRSWIGKYSPASSIIFL